MKNKTSSLTPVGISLKREVIGIAAGFALSILFSCSYLLNYFNAYCNLFFDADISKPVIEGRKMVNFCILLDDCFTGFRIISYLFIVLAVYHYAYHFRESKSIYTMKRLPKKNDLYKRCLAVPLLGILSVVATVITLTGLYYLIYIKVTPKECLIDGQIGLLFKHIINGGV